GSTCPAPGYRSADTPPGSGAYRASRPSTHSLAVRASTHRPGANPLALDSQGRQGSNARNPVPAPAKKVINPREDVARVRSATRRLLDLRGVRNDDDQSDLQTAASLAGNHAGFPPFTGSSPMQLCSRTRRVPRLGTALLVAALVPSVCAQEPARKQFGGPST